MTETPISVLKEAAARGLRLEAQPDGLHVNPGELCSPAFEETLRASKPYLLVLLSLPFVMVNSKTLEQTIFFCEDEPTKAALIEAGADEFSIYTKDELRILVEHNRIAPLTPDELRKVHEIKRTFHGKSAREGREQLKKMKSEKDQTDAPTMRERIQCLKLNHENAGKWMEKLSPPEVSELGNRIVDFMAALEVIDFAYLMRLHHSHDRYAGCYSCSELKADLWEQNCLIDAYEELRAAMQRTGVYQKLKPAMQRMRIYYPYVWNKLVEGADPEATAELAEQARKHRR